MKRTRLLLAALLCFAATAGLPADAKAPLAPTPPMGWNSWDSYGLTIDEHDYRANTRVLASIKNYGWQYSVVDEGWYMANPNGKDRIQKDFQIDSNGLLVPALDRFPSAADGAGFKPLADWVHSHGLKFGFHIVRGIPRGAVERNTPIAGSSFHAADAADTSDACGWDDGNWGVRDNAAGQAYYDSMMRLYANWGVDFLKVDCIADHPYKVSEIRQIASAIRKTGRPIILSLSPGPTQLEHANEIARYSQMWRISNDIWDGWEFGNHTPDGYPSGVETAFDNLARWNPYVRPGSWPDADMLPLGSLRPHPGMGDPRESRLSHDEERTQFTLWSIARSPLILGANLTQLDPFTRSLITNRRVIGVNEKAWESHPVANLPAAYEQIRVWEASAGTRNHPVHYVAYFNTSVQPVSLPAKWSEIGIEGRHSAVELWSGTRSALGLGVELALPAHGTAIYQLR